MGSVLSNNWLSLAPLYLVFPLATSWFTSQTVTIMGTGVFWWRSPFSVLKFGGTHCSFSCYILYQSNACRLEKGPLSSLAYQAHDLASLASTMIWMEVTASSVARSVELRYSQGAQRGLSLE
jgi:hypothetical protein